MMDKLLKMRDIRSIDRVVVLANELNYQRAANILRITQSALSRSIANLEESLGICLFDRDQTGVRLTPLGREFLVFANRLVNQVDEFVHEIDALSAGSSGRAAFGITPALAQLDIVKRTLAMSLVHNSDFHIEIVEQPADTLLNSLLKEDVEFYIAAERDVDTISNRLVLKHLCHTEFVVAARKCHPLFSKNIINLNDMSEYPMLSPRIPMSNGYNGDATYGWRHEYNIRTTIHCDDVLYLMDLADKTDSLIVVMKNVLLSHPEYNLVELPLGGLIDRWKDQDIVLVTLENRKLSPMARSIINDLASLRAEPATSYQRASSSEKRLPLDAQAG